MVAPTTCSAAQRSAQCSAQSNNTREVEARRGNVDCSDWPIAVALVQRVALCKWLGPQRFFALQSLRNLDKTDSKTPSDFSVLLQDATRSFRVRSSRSVEARVFLSLSTDEPF
jgi:hypothetical protein